MNNIKELGPPKRRCPFPGCIGKSNKNSIFKKHYTRNTCPLAISSVKTNKFKSDDTIDLVSDLICFFTYRRFGMSFLFCWLTGRLLYDKNYFRENISEEWKTCDPERTLIQN